MARADEEAGAEVVWVRPLDNADGAEGEGARVALGYAVVAVEGVASFDVLLVGYRGDGGIVDGARDGAAARRRQPWTMRGDQGLE